MQPSRLRRTQSKLFEDTCLFHNDQGEKDGRYVENARGDQSQGDLGNQAFQLAKNHRDRNEQAGAHLEQNDNANSQPVLSVAWAIKDRKNKIRTDQTNDDTCPSNHSDGDMVSQSP